MNIITLQEYKMVKGASQDPKDDLRLQFLIDAASNMILSYLDANLNSGRVIREVKQIDYDTDTIFLDYYPVSSISAVVEYPRYTIDSTIHVPLTGGADYISNLENGTLTRLPRPGGFARWPLDPGAIIVEYTIAPTWDVGYIPADLKLAAVYLVDYYKSEEYRPSKSVGGNAVVNMATSKEDFPKHIQMILDRYKR